MEKNNLQKLAEYVSQGEDIKQKELRMVRKTCIHCPWKEEGLCKGIKNIYNLCDYVK